MICLWSEAILGQKFGGQPVTLEPELSYPYLTMVPSLVLIPRYPIPHPCRPPSPIGMLKNKMFFNAKGQEKGNENVLTMTPRYPLTEHPSKPSL
jgi:hypothetical protein